MLLTIRIFLDVTPVYLLRGGVPGHAEPVCSTVELRNENIRRSMLD